MQATGVVIGFVIVAGVFLGAADWVAGKLVDFHLEVGATGRRGWRA